MLTLHATCQWSVPPAKIQQLCDSKRLMAAWQQKSIFATGCAESLQATDNGRFRRGAGVPCKPLVMMRRYSHDTSKAKARLSSSLFHPVLGRDQVTLAKAQRANMEDSGCSSKPRFGKRRRIRFRDLSIRRSSCARRNRTQGRMSVVCSTLETLKKDAQAKQYLLIAQKAAQPRGLSLSRLSHK